MPGKNNRYKCSTSERMRLPGDHPLKPVVERNLNQYLDRLHGNT